MKRFLKTNYKKIIILSLIFFIMLLINILTPLMSDDFGYSFNLDHERLRGIKDIINFQIVHYKWWGGRIVAHTLVQLFLLGPKIIFNIFNTLCFTILIYLIYAISKKEKEENILAIPLIFFLVYFLQPVLGQCCFWLTGSCNYLWTTTIILLLLYFYVKKDEMEDSIIFTSFIFVLGIVAGWTNENSSFGLFSILILILLCKIKTKTKINKWQIFGVIGNIIGFIIMILAPGNYLRKDGYVEEMSFIEKILTRFIECTKGIFKYESIIIFIFILLIAILIYKKKKVNRNSIIFMLGSIASVYPMVMSPTFPERSWFAITIFGIISIMILINEMYIFGKKEYKYFMIAVTIILTIIFIPNYINLVKDVNKLNNVWNKRITYIKDNPNEKTYKFKEYSTQNKKNPMYDQLDLVKDSKAWPNKDIANYYNIKNISIKD